MRPHDIVSRILFILSIIDFALAAPVLLAQEKRQAPVVDAAVHIPKDAMAVWGKRGKEPDDLLPLPSRETWEKYFESLEREMDNSKSSASDSDSHSDSSADSGPSNPNPWWTNAAVQRPPARPASAPDLSAPNPNELDDGLWAYKGNGPNGNDEPHDGQVHGQVHTGTPTPSAYASSGYASDGEFAQAHAPSPNHNPMMDSDSDLGPDPDYDLDYWMDSEPSEDRVDHGPPTTGGAASASAETNVAE